MNASHTPFAVDGLPNRSTSIRHHPRPHHCQIAKAVSHRHVSTVAVSHQYCLYLHSTW
jgi:hypothetical protein